MDRWIFPFALLALVASACGGPPKSEDVVPAPGEWHAFEGTWSATGQRQTLHLGLDRKVSIVTLTGTMLLVGERRLGEGFQSRVIAYSDSLKGGGGWCVWTDSRGDRIFSELRGEPIGARRRFVGSIQGGTGRYAGITGEYEFEWQYVVGEDGEEDGAFQGRAVALRGRFRRVDLSSPPPPDGSGATGGEGLRS